MFFLIMRLEKTFLFMVMTLEHASSQTCFYNFSDRGIPGDVISLYERNEGFIEPGCPLVHEIGDFVIGQIPTEFNKYFFGQSLLDGACIPRDYENGKVPMPGGLTGNNERIKNLALGRGGGYIADLDIFFLPYATVYTTITNKRVREIRDDKRTITLDMALTMMWMDYEIYTYEAVFGQFLKHGTDYEITLENAKHIWKPDVPIYELYDYKSFSDSFRMVRLRIMRSTHFDDGLCMAGPMLQYDVEMKVTIYCDLDFSDYPMDESTCQLQFGGQRSNLKFLLYDPDNNNHKNQTFMLSDLSVDVSVAEYNDYEPSKRRIGLKINIHRHLQPYVLKYYLPCIIITLVSQCSFLIPLEALPGRVALVVTQLLTLTSLFIHEMVRVSLIVY